MDHVWHLPEPKPVVVGPGAVEQVNYDPNPQPKPGTVEWTKAAQQALDSNSNLVTTIADNVKPTINGTKAATQIDADPDQRIKDAREIPKSLRDKFKEAVGKGGTEDILYAQRLGTVANSLPGVTRGILSAKAAFERGDQIGGSAAILDICAAAAPALGVLAALGPEGAAIGALFSVIGLIIGAFGEKQPSVAEQITDVLKELNAEEQMVNLGAIEHSLDLRNKDLQGVYLNVAEALKIEVNTLERAHEFEVAMKAEFFQALSQKFADTISEFQRWQVAAWLKNEKKQHYRQWPEVLALWCRSYCDLVASNTMFNSSIDLAALAKKAAYFDQKYIVLVDKNGKPTINVLSGERKETLHGLCTNILALAKAAREHSENANKVALDILEAITPAAQKWGMMVCLRRSDNGMFFIRPQESKWIDRTDARFEKLAVAFDTSGTSGTDGFNPPYHCFVRNETSHAYFRINPETYAVFDKREGIARTEGATDMCVAELDKGRADFWVGQAIGNNKGGVVHYSYAGGQVQEETVFTVPWPVRFVRIAAFPGLAHPAIYVGHDATPDIWVHVKAWNRPGWSVRSPWDRYSGIAVDSRYVWVFHPGGFACATHASVLKTVAGAKPQWMEYQLPNRMLVRLWDQRGQEQALGVSGRWKVDGGPETASMPPLKGLNFLSPCDDGTISASIVLRHAEFNVSLGPGRLYWDAKDNDYKPWTATFAVDAKAGKMAVGEWTPIEVGGGNVSVREMHKVPIGCWPLLDSLKTKLNFKAA